MSACVHVCRRCQSFDHAADVLTWLAWLQMQQPSKIDVKPGESFALFNEQAGNARVTKGKQLPGMEPRHLKQDEIMQVRDSRLGVH